MISNSKDYIRNSKGQLRKMHRGVCLGDQPQAESRASWGPWRWNFSNLTLVLTYDGERDWYYVDVEECLTPAEMLDWIFQVAGHTWATPEIVGQLVVALNDLLGPQENPCSDGRALEISDLRKVLRSRGYWA